MATTNTLEAGHQQEADSAKYFPINSTDDELTYNFTSFGKNILGI